MQRERLLDLRDRFEYLDDRWTYRIRPTPGGGMIRPTPEELEKRLGELAEFTLQLKDLLRELLEAELDDSEEG